MKRLLLFLALVLCAKPVEVKAFDHYGKSIIIICLLGVAAHLYDPFSKNKMTTATTEGDPVLDAELGGFTGHEFPVILEKRAENMPAGEYADTAQRGDSEYNWYERVSAKEEL